jgi:hypothetical protein
MNLRRDTLFTLALLGFLCAVSWASRGFADHDRIPDPPPHSTSQKLQPVPKLDRTAITVSGLSSGGFFAHQFHVAYSKLVTGAGIIAGGPFRCVETIANPYYRFWSVPLDRVSAATVACTHYFGDRYWGLRPSPPKAEDALKLVRQAHQQGLVDDPANLTRSRVWLFHGKDDGLVPQATMDTLKQLYAALGLHEPQLASDANSSGQVANHGIPVTKFIGESKFPVRACGQHEPPYVIECGYEAAGLLLRHLYPDTFKDASDDAHRDGILLAFDQGEFFDRQDPSISLHGIGYVYVPQSCVEGECRLHVAFHGCKQTLDSIHDDFIRDAGYNRWAATNNIVVLYPQIMTSTNNPNGCWDWWGYAGEDYYGQQGKQMSAVRSMVDRLLTSR